MWYEVVMREEVHPNKKPIQNWYGESRFLLLLEGIRKYHEYFFFE